MSRVSIFGNTGIYIHLLVMTVNPWLWIIFQNNLIVGLLVFVLSLAVYIYFWQIKSTKILLLVIMLTTAVFFLAVKEAFDESIFRNSALDIQQLTRRHEFFANGLGKAYTNRISLTYFKDFSIPLYKLERNFFSNLDLNLYFFASHPRERIGLEEFEKYLPIFIPFFLLGFFYIIYKPFVKFFLYLLFISLISTVISPYYNMGPILFFPIFSVIITIGLLLSLKRVRLVK